MTFPQFKDTIRLELSRQPDGLTWNELRSRLQLPYERPCPTWVRQLEDEIGLKRVKGAKAAKIWMMER